MSQPVGPAKGKKKKHEDWEIEGAMNDLMRAEKHKNDPDLMKRVHALAGRHMKQVKAIRSIKDIREAYQDKYGMDKPKKMDEEDGQ